MQTTTEIIEVDDDTIEIVTRTRASKTEFFNTIAPIFRHRANVINPDGPRLPDHRGQS